MKKGFFKSFTALMLSLVMLMGTSTFVFAATNDPLKVATTIKGAPLVSTGTLEATYAAITTKGLVYLTAEQAANSEGISMVGFDTATDSYKVVRIPAASTATAAETGFGALVTAGEYTNGPLSNGDWIVFGLHAGSTTYTAATKWQIIEVKIEEGNVVGGAIAGDSSVKEVVTRVVVPIDLSFAIDPLQFTQTTAEAADANGQKKNQIVANMFSIINKSNAPVMVSFDLVATPTDGVSLFDQSEIATNISTKDVSKVSKNIYLAAIGAATVTESLAKDVANAKVESMTFDTTKTETVVAFGKASKTAYLDFLLAATDGTTDSTKLQIAATGKGSSAFTIYAEMNAYAPWKDSDIKISGVYTLRPVSPDTVTDLVAKAAANSVNQLKLAVADRPEATPIADVTISKNGTANFTVVRATGKYTAYLQGKPATITEVKNLTNGYVFPNDGSMYTYDKDTGVYTQTTLSSADVAFFQITTSDGVYTAVPRFQ